MSLHWFDLGSVLFLFACIIYSSLRGFLKELFTVLAWIAGYFGSINLHPMVTPYLRAIIKTSVIADLVTFFVLFASLYMFVRLIGLFAQKRLGFDNIPSEINHGAGAIMGVAKWIFFLAIFLSPLSYFPEIKAELEENSIAAALVLNATQQLDIVDTDNFSTGKSLIKNEVKKFKGKVAEEAIERIVNSGEDPTGADAGKVGESGAPVKKIEPIVKAKDKGKLPESEKDRKEMDDFVGSF